jgi:hypothetical protein
MLMRRNDVAFADNGSQLYLVAEFENENFK